MSILNKFSLNNKIALVTGASYGIGFEIAKSLADAGAKIVFNDVVPENLQKGLDAYKAAGIDAHGYLFDITDEEVVEKSIAQIEKEHGVIDILVNNAGIIQRKSMLETSAADYRKIIDIDLTGQFIMAKAVLPSMIKKGSGKIINICSMMSELGRETVVGYASAKGGLKMLTKNICSELPIFNVMVLVRVILLHLKLHHYVRNKQMVLVTHLISLLLLKHLQDDGVPLMI